MRINVVRQSYLSFDKSENCLALPVFEDSFPLFSSALLEEDAQALQQLAEKHILTGKSGACYYWPKASGAYRGILTLGLGKRDLFTAETLRRAAGKACTLLNDNRVSHVYLDATREAELPVAAFLEGLVLGQYDFDVYKVRPADAAPPARIAAATIVVGEKVKDEPLRKQFRLDVLMALGTNGARHLANTPANEMTPAALAEFARGIARESGCDCTVLEQTQLASLGMNALLGVARGSSEAPKLIVLRHDAGPDAPTVAMVGKGVTFDTGGLSLKPPEKMHEMKYDMSGAAAVLCAMMCITEQRPKVNVVAVVPAAENKPGPDAQCPGDIVRAYNGKTIEVHNTDAEGRLLLADALSYTVDKFKPDAMVDIATLTGACVVALGHHAAGILGNDDDLISALIASGENTGERLWRLPLWKDHEELVEGTHADLCNIGPKGEAGTIAGAAFLKAFVGDTPWAHIDIAGTAWGAKHLPYLDAKHATGFGVRLLTHWILNRQAPAKPAQRKAKR
jgi:leucyl aminopeptidase